MCVEEGDDKQNNKKVTSPGECGDSSFCPAASGRSATLLPPVVTVLYSRRRVDIYAGENGRRHAKKKASEGGGKFQILFADLILVDERPQLFSSSSNLPYSGRCRDTLPNLGRGSGNCVCHSILTRQASIVSLLTSWRRSSEITNVPQLVFAACGGIDRSRTK